MTTTRAQAVLEAVRRELAERRAHLDAADNITEVTITVKLQPGTTTVRGTVYHDERTVRRV